MEIGADVKADLQQVTFIGSGLHHAKATRFEHYVKNFYFWWLGESSSWLLSAPKIWEVPETYEWYFVTI